MTDETVIRWSNGRFEEVARPEWWAFELATSFTGDAPSREGMGHSVFGEEHVQQVESRELTQRRGWMVAFDCVYDSRIVWAPTAADYLDLLTTRVPAFLSLPDRNVAASLQVISETLIAYARHGQGEHVSRMDGRSDIDRRQERERQHAQRPAGRAAPASLSLVQPVPGAPR
ncbi:hypothetical protein [Roseomonas sp. BN140053]|uniref:hypothetical protein n=1 Tax=Roseomonas sp. BN140053 TaxID=3391898 RepID=UPI0039E91B5A